MSRIYRQCWLSVNEEWLRSGQTEADAHDRFGIGDRMHKMPSFVVPGDLSLDDALAKLQPLKPGAVAMGYGTFWVFWETDEALITEEEDEDTSISQDTFERTSGKILDMHGGCYQLQENGEWDLLGAS